MQHLLHISLDGFFVCLFLRMTMRVALAPQVAVSQTAPRLWPSPAAFSRLPPVTPTCHQVSDGPGASKPLPPPCSENGNKGRNYLCGGGSRHGVRLRLVPFILKENVLYLALSHRGKKYIDIYDVSSTEWLVSGSLVCNNLFYIEKCCFWN